jgi:glutamyl-tRNA reductase
MKIITLGVTHKTAPVEVLEQLAIGRDALNGTLRLIAQHPNVLECAALSTCNRVEVYAAVTPPAPVCFLRGSLSGFDLARRADLEGRWIEFEPPESIRHLFEVASGLDAMVVGEQEIVAQVKEAFREAREAQTIGPVLGALFRKALSVSKRVRTETDIGRAGLSVASVAVQLARQIFGELGRRRVLILGAGATGEAVLRHLVKNGARSVTAANRSFERAEALATRFGGRAVPFEARADELARADIVISTTASPEPVLTAEALRDAMRRRRGRPILLVDIAVPRDVEPEANAIEGVYLYDLDDLKSVVREQLKTRTLQLDRGRAIVDEETRSYEQWLERQALAPTLKRLYERFEAVRARELEDHLRGLRDLTPELRERFEQLSKHLVKQLLHGPVSRLRRVADPAALVRYTEALNELFDAQSDARPEEENGGE